MNALLLWIPEQRQHYLNVLFVVAGTKRRRMGLHGFWSDLEGIGALRNEASNGSIKINMRSYGIQKTNEMKSLENLVTCPISKGCFGNVLSRLTFVTIATK